MAGIRRRSSHKRCSGGDASFINSTTPSPSAELLHVRPHFFKLIVNPAVQLHQLRLPREFVAKHDNSLRNRAKLSVPEAGVWTAKLWRDDQDVWLGNGWKMFVRHFSIRRGHFLLFRYDDQSNFQVQIFDMSGCEIKYDRFLKQPVADYYGVEDNDPSHFSILMSESYVTKLCIAAVPASGKSEHLLNYQKGKKRKVFLYGPDKKKLAVPCYYDIRKKQVRLRMHHFVRNYRVKEGDVCRFELIEGTRDSYNVHVNREHAGRNADCKYEKENTY